MMRLICPSERAKVEVGDCAVIRTSCQTYGIHKSKLDFKSVSCYIDNGLLLNMHYV